MARHTLIGAVIEAKIVVASILFYFVSTFWFDLAYGQDTGQILARGHWETGNRNEFVYVSLSDCTWEKATSDLKNLLPGFHLASITSQEEHDFVIGLLDSVPSFSQGWLGGFQEPPDEPEPATGWVWITGEAWSYTNWHDGEPNDGGGCLCENHLAIDFHRQWNDEGTAIATISGYFAESFEPLMATPAASPDIHWSVGNTLVADQEAVSDTVTRDLFSPTGLPEAADVDALHGLSNGDILFSLEVSLKLGGVIYRPNDVIRFNGSSWSKEFDGLAAGIPAGVNINAVARSGGSLLFSIDVAAELGSIAVSDADIIAFDGENLSLFMSASELGIDAHADVDALHVDTEGRILISLDNSGELGGVNYRDEDLLARENGNWYLDIENNEPAWIAADLDAWSIVFFEDDIIFANGFE